MTRCLRRLPPTFIGMFCLAAGPAANTTSPRSACWTHPNGAAVFPLDHAVVRLAWCPARLARPARGHVVKGPAQESDARTQGWQTVAVQTNGELAVPLIAGVAQATVVPMNTAIHFVKDKEIQCLGLSSTVMKVPEPVGSTSFSINPLRSEHNEAVDTAFDRIRRNGVYERINTQFLPFRVQ